MLTGTCVLKILDHNPCTFYRIFGENGRVLQLENNPY